MLLGQYQDNFRKLCTALTKVDQDSKSSQKFIETEAVMKEFKKRSEELRHFQELKSHVGNFLSMCRSSKEGNIWNLKLNMIIINIVIAAVVCPLCFPFNYRRNDDFFPLFHFEWIVHSKECNDLVISLAPDHKLYGLDYLVGILTALYVYYVGQQ